MNDNYDPRELIYDWNQRELPSRPARLQLNDETLRDGLQSPSIIDPAIEVKLEALGLMNELGITHANIGMPCTSPKIKAATLQLARAIADQRYAMVPNCAARTVPADIEPIVEISQAAGIPVTASTFIGSSPIRGLAEGWELDRMLRSTEAATRFAVEHDLPAMYVTEDTTRARPEVLKQLYRTAIDNGATRLVIADTVGHSTPQGVRAIVRFFREEIVQGDDHLKLDWHGHNDRGLAVANSLAALEAGADCVHGTMLGIGERVGNTALDHLLVNLKLLDWIDGELLALARYARLIHEHCGGPLPFNYPVLGRDAFRTSTGVHAAAIIKAQEKGDQFLADRVYSGVPAGLFGRVQEIEVGPMSGRSNVAYWLRSRQIEASDDVIDAILERAKSSARVLSELEILDLARPSGRPISEEG